uniref:Uncharacterized protein n=1 Tax=Anguilla anguilla TaxID=7936 RepID=A0A0E9WEP6_ANGAN
MEIFLNQHSTYIFTAFTIFINNYYSYKIIAV